MKVLILDKKPSDMRIEMEDFLREFSDREMVVEQINSDSSRGAQLTELYDALAYPSIIITRDDGQLVRMWQGRLPTVSDVLQNYGIESS